MPEDAQIRFVGDLERLVLRPGDQFILTVPDTISREQQQHIQSAWEAFVGGDREKFKLMILSGGAKLGAISTP